LLPVLLVVSTLPTVLITTMVSRSNESSESGLLASATIRSIF
jgi:hypothetical protein